ncbi:MAG: hypothetical protein AAFU50_03565, partial [Pseudomonadota bacterium]
ELSLTVSEFRLPPHRIALLIFAPIATFKLLGSPETRVRSFDILMFLYAAWSMLVYHAHGEEIEGLVFGGSLALESFGGYVIARAYIRDLQDFRVALDLLVIAAIIALCFSLPETLFGKHFTHDYLQKLTGYEHLRELETRLGLTRAYGTFDHPIHLGTFAAATIGLIWFSGHRLHRRIVQCMFVGLTTLSALSSAPILCALIQGALAVWDRVTRGLQARVLLTISAVVVGYVVISAVANRTPIMIIATSLTLDSWTGYYRTIIWEHGLNNVWENPWMGIGQGDWTRPWWMHSDSIDAYWLVVAARTGLPSFFMLVIAIGLQVRAMAYYVPRQRDPAAMNAMKAWLFSFLALTLIACTVHFWNVMHAYFFFFIGLSGWLADPMKARYRERRAAKRRGRRSKRVPIRRPQTGGTGPAVPGLSPVPTAFTRG